MVNPTLPQEILDEAVPGNIRKAEHFVMFLGRYVYDYDVTNPATMTSLTPLL